MSIQNGCSIGELNLVQHTYNIPPASDEKHKNVFCSVKAKDIS
jgi:hypothetical protein